MRLKSLILVIIFLSGCSTFQNISLPLPMEPNLITIQKGELQCLTDETVEKLRSRDIQRENYEDELESIIKSTH